MSASEDSRPADFVGALVGLAEREDRASLAALRRSVGRELADPAEAAAVFYSMLPSVPEWAERDYWLGAGLFALHPAHRAGAERGRPLAAELHDVIASEPSSGPPLERRFISLLDAEREDLGVMLRSIVHLLRQHDQPLDYAELVRDLQRWGSGWRGVQRRWARAFWRPGQSQAPDEPAEQPADVEVSP